MRNASASVSQKAAADGASAAAVTKSFLGKTPYDGLPLGEDRRTPASPLSSLSLLSFVIK